MNRPIISGKIESVIKKPPNKAEEQMFSLVHTTSLNINSNSQLIPKKLKRTFPNTFHETEHYFDTKFRPRHYNKRKLQANISNKYRSKHPQQNYKTLMKEMKEDTNGKIVCIYGLEYLILLKQSHY